MRDGTEDITGGIFIDGEVSFSFGDGGETGRRPAGTAGIAGGILMAGVISFSSIKPHLGFGSLIRKHLA
jgi:hypothetical protein